jgi:KaiC/GvpD/RAD55 family RecA-like ATPase
VPRFTKQLAEEAGKLDWIKRPIVPAGARVAIFGEPGSGKSLFCLQLAYEAAQLGEKVLYLDFENPLMAVKQRVIEFGMAQEIYETGSLWIETSADFRDLDTPEGGADLLDMLDHQGFTVVIFDSWSSAVSGGENDNDTYRAMDRYSLDELSSRQITAVLIDHVSVKASSNGAKTGRGASRKLDQVDVAWRFQPTGKRDVITEADEFMLVNTKDRLGLNNGKRESYTRHREPLRFTWNELHADTLTPNQIRIVAKLDELGTANGTSLDECQEQLRGTDGKGVKRADLVVAQKYRQHRGL